jgi:hypothetical protein
MSVLLIILETAVTGDEPYYASFDAFRKTIEDRYKKDQTRLAYSTYAVNTSETPQEIKGMLTPLIPPPASLTILTAQRPGQVWCSERIHRWLKKNLPGSPENR